MRTIIAGSRSATKQDVLDAISSCPWSNEITLVLSGMARGADTHGFYWAIDHHIPTEQYPADWSKYGQRAGMIRNEQMARNAQALIAVWDGSSKGTAHMIQIAKLVNLKVFVHKFSRNLPVYELDESQVHDAIISELIKSHNTPDKES